MKCKHVDEETGDIYTYDIGNDEEVILCPDCNANLAGEITKQQALETFIKKQ